MSKRKKKEAAAKIVVVGVMALCLILLAIFGIWLIGRLTGEDGPDVGLEGDQTTSADSVGGDYDSDDEILIAVGKYIYEMQSSDIVTLFYGDNSIDISAADASAPYDVQRLRDFVSAKGDDPAIVDRYLALGNSPDLRETDEAYVKGSVYSLNDMINRANVQGYTVEDRKVTIYKSDKIVSVDADATCLAVLNAMKNGSFGRLEATVTVDESGEPNWEEISQRVNVEPKDAQYVLNEETKRSELQPEEVGYVLDIEKVRREYNASSEKVLVFEAEEVAPEITLENINEKLFPDEITYYKSWYNANEENRTNNLLLAAEAINGEVVLPGQRFSFNTVVGERTPERGYKKATIYTREGMTDDYGGGICQVVSTLYSALLYEDFKIVERREHGYTVSYVDLGKDATVAYGWIDFRFENNFEHPIMITTRTDGGYLFVEIMGTKVDDIDVTIRHETVEVIEPEIDIEEDETLDPEEYVLESKGKKGYIIKTFMAVTKNGEYLGERLLHTSNYSPLNGTARVGVDWTESTEPAETTAGTSETTDTSDTSGTTVETPPETSETPATSESTEASTEATTESSDTPPESGE